MNKPNNPHPFPSVLAQLAIVGADEQVGRKKALALLKAAITSQVAGRNTAILKLSSRFPAEAQQTIAQTMSSDNVGEFAIMLNHQDPGVCKVVTGAFIERYTTSLDKTFQNAVLQALTEEYEMPPVIARQFITGQLAIRDWLYPFKMRLAVDEVEFHIEELLHEPEDSVTASQVTVWIYRDNHRITDLVLAGHANAPICKEISAKLFTVFLEHEETGGKEGLMVPGAFLMQAPPSSPQQAPPPLEGLVQQLRTIQELTGLVTLCEINTAGYAKVNHELRQQIEQGWRSKSPVLLCRSNPSAPSRAVFMPFYMLRNASLSPLNFELDLALFACPEFDKLLQTQREELQREMIADANRRKRIYEEWHERDRQSMQSSAYRLLERILPRIPWYELNILTEAYIKVLLDTPPESLASWLYDLPAQARSALIVKRTQRLRQFVNTHKPGFIHSDAEWERALKLIQDRELPVRGMRNFAEATVTDAGEISGYISLQESVEWNLPHMIRSDNEWIERMNQLLRNFEQRDPKREARMDAINLGTLLDAFLRGWPPVFLAEETSRNSYKVWCTQRREGVWRAIHQWLMERGVRMDALQEDNVIFAIKQLERNKIQVTPYYLTTDRNLMVLLHPRFGMTYYVNLWQRRQRVEANLAKPTKATNNRSRAQVAVQAGEQALAMKDVGAAKEHFKQALRIHPAAGAAYLFARFWATTSRATATELKELITLIEAMNAFFHGSDARRQAVEKLQRFIENYPDFLADPYLLLGYHTHEPLTRVPALETHLNQLQKQYNQLIEALQTLEKAYNKSAESLNKLREQHNALFELLIVSGALVPDDEIDYSDFLLPGSPFDRQAADINDAWKLALQSDDWSTLSSLLSQEKSLPTPSQPAKAKPTRYKVTGWAASSEIERLNRLQNQIQSEEYRLKPQREEFDRKAAQLEPLREQIVQARGELFKAQQEAWQSLQTIPNDALKHAMLLDSSYVTHVLSTGGFTGSDGFRTHVAPLYGLFKADEYLRIERELRQSMLGNGKDSDLIDQLKDRNREHQQATLDKLRAIVDRCLVTHYLESQEIGALKDLRNLLDQFSQDVDTLARESMIRAHVKEIGADYVRRAYKLYNEAAPRVPEITEVRQQLCSCQYLLTLYQHAIQTLIGAPKLPVQNGFAQARFKILFSKPNQQMSAVALAPASNTVQVTSLQGQTQAVLEIHGLDSEEHQHLATELARPDYPSILKNSKLPPAYGILLTPIPAAPHLQRWQTVLLELKVWLIKVLAYTGITPVEIETARKEEVFAHFDHTPTIEQIVVDPVTIRTHFLETLDPFGKVKVEET